MQSNTKQCSHGLFLAMTNGFTGRTSVPPAPRAAAVSVLVLRPLMGQRERPSWNPCGCSGQQQKHPPGTGQGHLWVQQEWGTSPCTHSDWCWGTSKAVSRERSSTSPLQQDPSEELLRRVNGTSPKSSPQQSRSRVLVRRAAWISHLSALYCSLFASC